MPGALLMPECWCAQAEDELPERLLGTCRFSHLDMDSGEQCHSRSASRPVCPDCQGLW
jgi:hypothetical protein